MKNSQWLGGAFSAFGIASAISSSRKRHKISLLTSSGGIGYLKAFHEYVGLGRIEPYNGRWQWICDDADEVRQFHRAVGPHLVAEKREMIEAAWQTWRNRVIDATDGEVDPGAIDGEPTAKA